MRSGQDLDILLGKVRPKEDEGVDFLCLRSPFRDEPSVPKRDGYTGEQVNRIRAGGDPTLLALHPAGALWGLHQRLHPSL